MCTKSMKLKQKWCWSNDYSFFCVITWKLLFSGWGLTFGKGRIKIWWDRISTREDFSSWGGGRGGQQVFDWWGKFTTTTPSPIPPVGKVLIFLEEYCIYTTKLSFSNMIKLFNVIIVHWNQSKSWMSSPLGIKTQYWSRNLTHFKQIFTNSVACSNYDT